MNDPLREVVESDGRYAREAYQFLFDSLETAVELAGRQAAEGVGKHVTGQELLEGMRAHALHLFGPLGARVWRSWGVHSTMDWGRIVFILVESQLLNRQDSDTIEDFRDGFDLDEAFAAYVPKLPGELGAHPTEQE